MVGMDDKHRSILRTKRMELVRDMDGDRLASSLFSSEIFSEDDKDQVQAETTRRERNERLLDILPRRGGKAFDAFCNALSTLGGMSHLVELLKIEDGMSSMVQPEKPAEKKIVVDTSGTPGVTSDKVDGAPANSGNAQENDVGRPTQVASAEDSNEPCLKDGAVVGPVGEISDPHLPSISRTPVVTSDEVDSATPLLSSLPGQKKDAERSTKVASAEDGNEPCQNDSLVGGAVCGIPDPPLLSTSRTRRRTSAGVDGAHAATPLLSSPPGQADNDERPNQVPPSDETDEARQNDSLVGCAVGGMPDPSLLTGISRTRAHAATPLLSSAPGQANNDERPIQVQPSDETDEARQNNSLVGGAVGGMPDPSLLTISCLTFNDIDRLKKFLDTNSIGLKNWKDLAGKCGFSEEEKNDMGLANYGGGNPALHFFTNLKVTRDVTVKELISKCKRIQRNDCVKFLESKRLQESKNIDEIDVEIFEVLAGKLKEDKGGLPCWKNLADLFGLDQREIDQSAHSIIIPNQYSPTRILFNKLQANEPDMLISSLIYKLIEIGRKDVVKELEKIMKDK